MPTNFGTRATRRAVAEKANVSTAVVSYVVNNGPRPVAAGTRQRVLDAIAELGYRPNGVARALRLQKTHTYGVLVPDNSNPYFAELAKAIEDVAYERRHALVLGNSSNDPRREQAQLHALIERQVDGLLMISADAHPDLSALISSDIPVALLDRVVGGSTFPSISVDNEAGAYDAVHHLLEHGHPDVAYIAGHGESPAATDRERGWRRALGESRSRRRPRMVKSEFSRIGGYRAATELLSGPRPARAVFVASDIQAIGVLRACHDVGISVPDDAAVVSFDGTEESAFTSPRLSVIAQPILELARAAISLLDSTGPQREPRHHTLPHTFVARESCGCPGLSPDDKSSAQRQ